VQGEVRIVQRVFLDLRLPLRDETRFLVVLLGGDLAAVALDRPARQEKAEPAALAERLTPEGYLRLTPRTSSTDGFFVAVLERRDDRKAKSS